jgi:hypothetical protein
MIYRRGKHGTYWLRFRFAGRFVHESTRVDQDHKQDASQRGRASAEARTCGKVQRRPKTHFASYDLSGVEILDREACRACRRYPRNI